MSFFRNQMIMHPTAILLVVAFLLFVTDGTMLSTPDVRADEEGDDGRIFIDFVLEVLTLGQYDGGSDNNCNAGNDCDCYGCYC